MTSPIAINRSQGKAALKQIIRQGRDRLQKGLWIIIFPEGTRIDPGKKGRYGIGGAWLATNTGGWGGRVAHNAGVLWGKNSFIKFPGTITVSIGEPIDPEGMDANELNNKVEEWIELEVTRIGDKDTIKDK